MTGQSRAAAASIWETSPESLLWGNVSGRFLELLDRNCYQAWLQGRAVAEARKVVLPQAIDPSGLDRYLEPV